MKRKLALILAVCLAISPISASTVSIHAFAAEQEESGENTASALFSVFVSDEDGCELDEGAQYPLMTGETRNINTAVEGTAESSSYFVVWSSENPDIVSIDAGGALTALSPGTGKIDLSISNGADQYSFCYTIRVCDPEPEEEDEEETDEAAWESFDEIVEEADEEPSGETAGEAVEEPSGEIAGEAVEEPSGETEKDGSVIEGETAVAAEIAAPAGETGETATEIDEEAAQAGETTATAAATDIETDSETDADTEITPEGDTASESEPAPEGATAISAETAADVEPADAADTASNEAALAAAKSSTAAATGWQTIDGNIYYLDPKTGARKTGICRIDGKLYAFDANGKRITGPRWYNSPSGRCYVNGNGTLHIGWLARGGKWYYLGTNGIMRYGKLVLGGRIFFLDKNGAMRIGWYRFSTYNYYLSQDGSAVKGWQTIDGKKSFFDANCIARTGWYKPGNRVYYFDAKGRQQTGIVKIDKYIYYLRSDGIVSKGWKKVNGKWYYLNARSRALTGWITLDGKKYHLNKYGVMDTGYKTIGGVRYHFGDDGALIPSGNSYTNTQEFIDCIAPLIIKYAPQWGVKVYSPIIAQAILESASGQSSLGKKYNNFFGLKCGTLWTGPSVNLATGEEYTPGTYTTIYANFRVFSNMEEGVKGYFEFLFKNRDRYDNLIGETDPYRYLEKIKADGYATSSKYVQNTYNVIKSYNLTRFDP